MKLAILSGATALLVASASLGQQGGDLQAQILYAYHTEDANSLDSLAGDLAAQVKAEPADAALRYHLAHAQYRRALIEEPLRPRDAEKSLADCVDELKPVVASDVKSAEALVLQSACYSALAEHRRLESALLRTRAHERLKSALALDPHNPRAILLSAQSGLERASSDAAERRKAVSELELAARLFDTSSATSPEAPAWGDAEAYLALGQEMQRRGDRLGARNWIEKALIAAPDYKAAQRQLAALKTP